MRLTGLLIAVASLAVGSTANAAANVDLICDGTSVITEAGASKKTEKFHRLYRIDYETNRWCQDECSSVSPIIALSDQRITLVRGGGSRLSGDVFIDRIKGTVEGHSRFVSPTDDRTRLYDFTATCTPRPFSGLVATPEPVAPKPKF